ncbi:hypothetical protein FS749_011878 [Ceratobasidium sp. UAMH 11750]|nr:hypothetical protein FS749_011878 [Ceratobasidium sp. UAMH 11750]
MSVITLRAISFILIIYASLAGGFYHAIPCDDVEYVLNDKEMYARDYPQCQPGWTGSQVTHVSIEAGISNELAATAAIRAVFGASTWGGLWLNAIICEYYLYRTKDESDRLKTVSAKRQMLKEKKADKQES